MFRASFSFFFVQFHVALWCILASVSINALGGAVECSVEALVKLSGVSVRILRSETS